MVIGQKIGLLANAYCGALNRSGFYFYAKIMLEDKYMQYNKESFQWITNEKAAIEQVAKILGGSATTIATKMHNSKLDPLSLQLFVAGMMEQGD